MKHFVTILRLSIGIAFLALLGSADAQQHQKTFRESLHNTGQRAWVVTKSSLHDFSGKSDEEVADFQSEADARTAANKLNEETPNADTGKYVYLCHKRPESNDEVNSSDTPTGSAGRIEMPKKKVVDLGPIATKKKKFASLDGKTADGKIGDAKVEFEFAGGGKLIITGELEGTGKWWQNDTGALYMETERSIFRGNISGDEISGVRFRKDGTEPLVEWKIKLRTNNKENEQSAKAPSENSSAAGRWIWDTGASSVLKPDGTFTSFTKNGTPAGSGTWKQNGTRLSLVMPHATRDGTIAGDTFSGTIHFIQANAADEPTSARKVE